MVLCGIRLIYAKLLNCDVYFAFKEQMVSSMRDNDKDSLYKISPSNSHLLADFKQLGNIFIILLFIVSFSSQ